MKFEDLNLSKSSDGLVPAVIQDAATLKVLMLGYMNKEAFDKSMAEGRVTFYSRTRGKLWTKGETSGHFLDIVSVDADCDSDTLLIKAVPHGPICHRGTVSCFDTPANEGFIRYLQTVIQGRHAQMPEGSYTTRLFTKGVNKIAQKVGEEAVETVIAAVTDDKEHIASESADLLYHLIVLLSDAGLTLNDVCAVLEKREGVSGLEEKKNRKKEA